TTPATTIPGVIRLAGVVNASGHGISLTVAASGTQGRPLTISGGAPTSDSGALISIEWVRAGRADWTQVATATIAADGSFSVQWTPSANGQVELRALLAPAGSDATDSSGSAGLSRSAGGSASAAAGEIGTSAVTIPIFRNAVATLYGPGFWGHHTACGQRLTRTTLGVASRTLKCGTEVAVRYKGRELTVPVIDRGPFANRASWDLTMATAKALGISQTATIGTLASARVPTFAATASR
ncbi:MAG: septal ring lytic transglycosylase RlpA family protein, partial [Solirubrobacteraceae bacterium]